MTTTKVVDNPFLLPPLLGEPLSLARTGTNILLILYQIESHWIPLILNSEDDDGVPQSKPIILVGNKVRCGTLFPHFFSDIRMEYVTFYGDTFLPYHSQSDLSEQSTMEVSC